MPPPVTTGLQAHYDATAITGLSDGDPVAQWDDESGNGRHITQGTAANRPTYQTGEINGLPVVRFDGTNDRLTFAGTAGSDEFALPNTAFAVVRNSSASTTGNRHVFAGADGSARNHLLLEDGDWAIFKGGIIGDSGVSADTDPHYLMAFYNVSAAVNSTIRLDGAEIYNAGLDGSEGFRLIHVGVNAGNSGAFWEGDIAELLVYSRELTTQEISDTEDYLEAKWFTGGQTVAVGQATEAESALAVSPDKPITVQVGQASEAESALAVTPVAPKIVPIGTAIETELAQVVQPIKPSGVQVGQAIETESASTVTPTRKLRLGTVTEKELAQSIRIPRTVPVGQATETELGLQIIPVVLVPGKLQAVACDIAAPSVTCAAAAPSLVCSTPAPSITCTIET